MSGSSLAEQQEEGAPVNVNADQPDQYENGVTALKDGNFELAIELLGEALQQRTAEHGDLSLKAADVYFKLGCALLSQAQACDDFLTDTTKPGPPAASQPESKDKDKAGDEAGPSGSAPVTGTPQEDSKDSGSEEEEGAGEENEEEEDEASDLQLAWEHLEAAKVIWEKQSEEHVVQLADVHSLLGDVGLENEDFEGALSDYQEAAEYLERLDAAEQTGSAVARQRAELLYKQGMAWQFLDNAAEALSAGEAASKEAEDVAVLQADLAQKAEELGDAVKEQASTKDMVKAALQQLTGLGGAASSTTPTPPTPAFAAASSAAAPVQDLGVIGRGTKRIVLQPTQAPQGRGETGAEGAAPAAKKARSLEDLMGPDTGETSIGF